MSFGENLRAVRKERNISQEDLAAILHVSRQAISKWESDNGYPEVETLVMLAKELHISLDYLMENERKPAESHKQDSLPTGRLLIRSQDLKSIINCIKFSSCRVSKSKANVPQYALFGIDSITFWGENRTLLGWYADEESLEKEMIAITKALDNGNISYELTYAAKVKNKFMSVTLEEAP